MSDSCLSLSFPSLFGKEVVAEFNGPRLSSDGGLLLLRDVDEQIGLTAWLCSCLSEKRQASKVVQPLSDMFRQRVYGIAQGYEDCNDFDELSSDPLFKLSVGRKPMTGQALASQPTLSRFENRVTVRDLLSLSSGLVEWFIGRHHGTAVDEIVVDLDATDDPAHGQQELEFYHGYYECHCFLPLLVYASVNGGEQELVGAILRPGNKHAGHGSMSVLKRLVPRLQEAFPNSRVIVRGDAGFALPALYTWCEQSGIEYAISLAKNPCLRELSADLRAEAQALFEQSGQKVRRFGEIVYAAQTWERARRVIVKAEHTDKGENPRFVVTNRTDLSAEQLYGFYTDRGDVENRIKELKLDLCSGRTSCHRFVANQFRLLLHAVAFVLLQAVRRLLAGTEAAHFQVSTLRLTLLKVAALVRESCRRIVIQLPASYPYQTFWQRIVRQP